MKRTVLTQCCTELTRRVLRPVAQVVFERVHAWAYLRAFQAWSGLVPGGFIHYRSIAKSIDGRRITGMALRCELRITELACRTIQEWIACSTVIYIIQLHKRIFPFTGAL